MKMTRSLVLMAAGYLAARMVEDLKKPPRMDPFGALKFFGL